MTSRASLGRVNDVLRLELRLPGRPPDEPRPLLENDALRDGGPDSPSVAPVVLVGENERGMGVGLATAVSRFSEGISGFRSQHQHAKRFVFRAQGSKRRTSVDGVRLRVVADVGSLGLGDLHLAVLLRLGQREVLLVPL